MTTIRVDLGENGYDVIVGSSILKNARDYLNLDRKVLIVTDDGVPCLYSKEIEKQCRYSQTVTMPQGESTKSFNNLQLLLSKMCEMQMDRQDCVVAVGGGVVGDLAGFAASCYMRGVDFYNIPTTLLSQVDSSIGGKTAINFNGIKNVVGAFYQPKKVLVDVDTLKTLAERHVSNGLAEAIKMSLTSSVQLFDKFERLSKTEILGSLEEIVTSAIKIKKDVVEKDEKENGLRRILNFGHTVGHGIESENNLDGLYHGECVALGMIVACGNNVVDRLVPVLKKVGLPTEYKGNLDNVAKFLSHDKKIKNGKVSVVLVNQVGSFEILDMTIPEIMAKTKLALGGKN